MQGAQVRAGWEIRSHVLCSVVKKKKKMVIAIEVMQQERLIVFNFKSIKYSRARKSVDGKLLKGDTKYREKFCLTDLTGFVQKAGYRFRHQWWIIRNLIRYQGLRDDLSAFFAKTDSGSKDKASRREGSGKPV